VKLSAVTFFERAILKQRCTIYDIARKSGVSTKTVSKVINNKPGVKESTRQKVWEIIRETGYYPHHGARSLRGRVRNCVGVTLAPTLHQVPLNEDFLLWLFAKLSEVFSSRGAYITFDLAPRSTATLGNDYGRGVWEQVYDSCLVVGPLPSDDTVIKRIHASGIPYLALGQTAAFPECSCASVDFFLGALESTRFLLNRGHSRIALLTAFEGYQAGADRIRGYKQALEESGIPFDPELVVYTDPTSKTREETVTKLMQQPGVTALVESSVAEDAGLLRSAAKKSGHVLGDSLECLVWTYSKEVAVLPEAVAHMWLPVLDCSVEGIHQLAEWMDGTREGPIHVVHDPVLSDAPRTGSLPKPTRVAELLSHAVLREESKDSKNTGV
jgi:LacI family transcriptional regulator